MFRRDELTWKQTRHEGVAIAFLASERDSGYAAVLISMDPGSAYPAHRHLGTEEVFVIEGAYEDEIGRHAAGSFVRYAKGSTHSPRCPEGGEACLFFAIAREGIELFAAD